VLLIEEGTYEQHHEQVLSEEDEEPRQLSKSLSKTDSLRDLKAFFSRDQLQSKTDGE